MSKFKMTVFSEIPVHPITLDDIKGGVSQPKGLCCVINSAKCNKNSCTGNKVYCKTDQCNGNTVACKTLGVGPGNCPTLCPKYNPTCLTYGY